MLMTGLVTVAVVVVIVGSYQCIFTNCKMLIQAADIHVHGQSTARPSSTASALSSTPPCRPSRYRTRTRPRCCGGGCRYAINYTRSCGSSRAGYPYRRNFTRRWTPPSFEIKTREFQQPYPKQDIQRRNQWRCIKSNLDRRCANNCSRERSWDGQNTTGNTQGSRPESRPVRLLAARWCSRNPGNLCRGRDRVYRADTLSTSPLGNY